MRMLKFFALVGIFSAFLRPLPTQAATANQLSDVHPNYVVIGAFRFHKNATRFTSHAQKDLQLNAKYELNKNRNLYYVYVLNTADREHAIAEARRLRSESEFKDTWVYSGMLGKNVKPGQAYSGVDINPMTNQSMDEVAAEKGQSAGSTEAAEISNSTSPGTTSAESVSTPIAEAKKEEKTEEPDSEVEGKRFFFSLSRATDNQKVEGDVDVIDLDKVKKMGTYKANMDVKITKPAGRSGKVSLVCEVFGYRKVQRELDYNSPEGEGIQQDENGAVVVPFELNRLQKGDIAIMYNVYFFNDAAIMRPESRYEVSSLLDMLKENPKYKIKIHGHTNGKSHGKILYLEEGSTNFFSISKTKEGTGTAKRLSEARAELIKNYLVANGVDENRMEVKAWGGKRPIHDKHSTRARENVRVEIEILED
jgi:outer membrane protein OmpA-like peptidoglycan-associated protein